MLEKIKSKMSGSVLIFTLLLLSIALVTALSLATAVVVGTKSASDTNKSVQAFQTADSGVETMLQKIKNANSDDLLTAIGCGSENKATGNIRSENSTYEITFYDSKEPANVLECSKKISDIAKIKSVGKFGGAIRAVETAVAAGGDGITGGCYVANNTTISDGWGKGCKADGQNNGGNRCKGAADNTHDCGFSAISGSDDYVCICIEK